MKKIKGKTTITWLVQKNFKYRMIYIKQRKKIYKKIKKAKSIVRETRCDKDKQLIEGTKRKEA